MAVGLTGPAVLAHVPIGQYNLPVPLLQVLFGAVIVVAASFALIYLLPPRRATDGDGVGGDLPGWIGAVLTAFAGAYVGFILLVSLFGRQEQTLVNGGAMLFWVWTVPLVPIAHCFVGGMYEVGNPFAFVARLLGGGHRIRNADAILGRLGYWPAAALMFALVWSESIQGVVGSPFALGLLALAYVVLQVSAGILLWPGWYRGGDVFQAITALASTVAPVGLRRLDNGSIHLVRGLHPARTGSEGAGREALITLWLAGVLADGIRALPVWKLTVAPQLNRVIDAAGNLLGPDTDSIIGITTEILLTWAAFAAFFWVFTYLAATLAHRPVRAVAAIVSPSLVPIALAYLLAHNLTQILVVGPLIVTARDAAITQLPLLVAQTRTWVHPGPVWWTQVAAIVVGHILAVVMAHARLEQGFELAATGVTEAHRDTVVRADLGWLSAMLIYTATSLWILAQPITTG